MSTSIHASQIYTKEQLCLMELIPEPCAIVIFGASGDLAHRKLFPSLFYLETNALLPKNYYVVGLGRTPLSTKEFQQKIQESLNGAEDSTRLKTFLERFIYLSGDYADPKFYKTLQETLATLDKARGVRERRLFYLSTPPSVYPVIIEQLGAASLAEPRQDPEAWIRLIIEKPFGRDLSSAKDLNKKVHAVFDEDQIYRIDHYLGKETVQNILVFRFANSLFEPAWNRNMIDHIQITAAEEIGVEHRAGYYEEAGVWRDMFQNHLFQLLALISMEPPARLAADAVRDKRMDVLNAIQLPLGGQALEHQAVCGQYQQGQIQGRPVPGYRQEPGVKPDSLTPTFAALKLEIDNWRWHGVPFYLRSGKRLGKRATEISVHFKHVPVSIFQPLLATQLAPNVLRFHLQPDEGVSICIEAKHPGPKLCLSTVTMDFDYKETFGIPPPEAYTRLFLDAMIGDQTLFARADSVERSWQILEPLLQQAKSLHFYPAGSSGPQESQELLARDSRHWDPL